ncbi:minor tail protein [Mycobacterium phage KingCyrus]|nr:minor tail protein [Mycobacterium phage KingCyrus]
MSGWTTNPSPIITPKSKGWSVSPTVTSLPAQPGWWAVVGIDTNLTVQFVTQTELTAIKQLGLVQAVTATRDLAFQAVKMLTVNAQIGATRNLGFSSVQNMSANQQVGLTPSLGFGFPPNGPLPQTFTTAIFTYTIPRWCNYIDVILLGGGGGGGGGASTTQSGAGGGPGSWLTVTLERGVHIPFSLVSFVGQLGTGGTGANGGITPTTGGNGNPTVIPSLSLSAAGGIGSASSNQDGMSPGTKTYNGVTYTGGAAVTSGNGTNGNPPGGGARGGNNGIFIPGSKGGNGGLGQAWFRAYQ